MFTFSETEESWAQHPIVRWRESENPEEARPKVLIGKDVEIQLAWANDTLSWFEISSYNNVLAVEESRLISSLIPQLEQEIKLDAINMVTFLAEQQHHPRAEVMRGLWHEFGKFGYTVNKKEAFSAYKRAAKAGYSRAEFTMRYQMIGTKLLNIIVKELRCTIRHLVTD